MKIKLKFYLVLVIIISLAILCIYLSTLVEPKIIVSAKINQLSKEDYQSMPQAIALDKDITKFKEIEFNIEITNPCYLIKQVNIEKSTGGYVLYPYLQENHKMQMIGGGMSGRGDNRELNETDKVYLNNIGENELRNIVDGLKFKVTWENIWNQNDSRIAHLEDYLK